MTKPQLSFEAFRAANLARCLKWHPEGINSWSGADWFTAILGELGELASLIKMANRERDGLPGNKFSPTSELISKEAADVVIYLDLFCASFDISLCTTFESFETLRKYNYVMFSRSPQHAFAYMDNSEFMSQLAQGIGKLSSAFFPLISNRLMITAVFNILQWLDIFCYRNNVELGQAIASKFNEVSERVGFPDRITVYRDSGMNSGDLIAAMMRDGAKS